MEKTRFMFIDDDDVFLACLIQACGKLTTAEPLVTARDGKEALDWLSKALQEKLPLPKILLVDINMPKMDGFAFLQGFTDLKYKYSEELSPIRPIAMLTSSNQESDRIKAAQLGADRYFVKPATLKEMRSIIEQLIAEVP